MPMLQKTVNPAIFLFYGRGAVKNLERTIKYFRNAFPNEAWRGLFFAAIADNTGIDIQVGAQVQGWITDYTPSMKASETVPNDLLNRVGEYMTMVPGANNVQIHLICDHFDDNMPADLPVQAAMAIANRFFMGNPEFYFYTMLTEDYSTNQKDSLDARRRHRAFMMALDRVVNHEDNVNMQAYPILLSRRAAQSAQIDSFDLWRALACTLLIMQQSKWHPAAGCVYSPGYASLNAKDSELDDLLEAAVKTRLDELSKREISLNELWELLTEKKIDASGTAMSITDEAAILRWLEELVDKYLINPTSDELRNLRVLSGVTAKSYEENQSVIGDVVCQFYADNCAEGYTDAGDPLPGSQMMQRIIDKHFSTIKDRFSGLLNVEQVSLDRMNQFISRLRELAEAKVKRPSATTWVKRKAGFFGLGGESEAEYLDQHFRENNTEIRKNFVLWMAHRIAGVAAAYFEELSKWLRKIQSGGELRRFLYFERTHIDDLADKYGEYWNKIAETMQPTFNNRLFENKWGDPSVTAAKYNDAKNPVYDSHGHLAEEMEARKKRAMETLRSALPSGFGGNFIHTIRISHADSIQGMNEFISRHMSAHPVMFSWMGLVIESQRSYYFVDKTLGEVAWTREHADDSFSVSNDNIEMLVLHTLALTTHDLLSHDDFSHDFNDVSINTDQFGTSARMFGNAGGTRWDDVADAVVMTETSVELIEPFTSTENFRLAWKWPEELHGADQMVIEIMQGPATERIPVTFSSYSGGVDITPKVRFGKNEVQILRGTKVYAKMAFPGKRVKVGYKLSAASLKVGKINRVNPKQMSQLRDEEADHHECSHDMDRQLSLRCVRRGSDNQPRMILYPVYAAVRSGMTEAVEYAGLKGMQDAVLQTSPSYRWPLLLPTTNMSL